MTLSRPFAFGVAGFLASGIFALLLSLPIQARVAPARRLEDRALLQILDRRLAGDPRLRAGIFDIFSLQVQDGVVTVGGYAHSDWARVSALAVVESQTGVSQVVDGIDLLASSPSDDKIRLEAARLIYSASGLGRYLADPAHSIHIIANDGNLILEGSVLNATDRTLAGDAAAATPGVFSVTNNLRIAQ